MAKRFDYRIIPVGADGQAYDSEDSRYAESENGRWTLKNAHGSYSLGYANEREVRKMLADWLNRRGFPLRGWRREKIGEFEIETANDSWFTGIPAIHDSESALLRHCAGLVGQADLIRRETYDSADSHYAWDGFSGLKPLRVRRGNKFLHLWVTSRLSDKLVARTGDVAPRSCHAYGTNTCAGQYAGGAIQHALNPYMAVVNMSYANPCDRDAWDESPECDEGYEFDYAIPQVTATSNLFFMRSPDGGEFLFLQRLYGGDDSWGKIMLRYVTALARRLKLGVMIPYDSHFSRGFGVEPDPARCRHKLQTPCYPNPLKWGRISCYDDGGLIYCPHNDSAFAQTNSAQLVLDSRRKDSAAGWRESVGFMQDYPSESLFVFASRCAECDCRLNSYETYHSEMTGEKFCESCYYELFDSCSLCSYEFCRADGAESPSGELICSECAGRLVTTCERCNEPCWLADVTTETVVTRTESPTKPGTYLETREEADVCDACLRDCEFTCEVCGEVSLIVGDRTNYCHSEEEKAYKRAREELQIPLIA